MGTAGSLEDTISSTLWANWNFHGIKLGYKRLKLAWMYIWGLYILTVQLQHTKQVFPAKRTIVLDFFKDIMPISLLQIFVQVHWHFGILRPIYICIKSRWFLHFSNWRELWCLWLDEGMYHFKSVHYGKTQRPNSYSLTRISKSFNPLFWIFK